MKNKLLIAAVLTGLLSGCVDGNSPSGSQEGVVKADPRYSECNLPDVNERGPIAAGLYISGTLPEGYWLMKPERKCIIREMVFISLFIQKKPVR